MTILRSPLTPSLIVALVFILSMFQPLSVTAADEPASSDTSTSTPPSTGQESPMKSSADTENADQSSDSMPTQTPPEHPTATSSIDLANIARAQFTTGIVDHEPVDNVTTIPNSSNKIYFFTEFKNLKGQTVTHRWEYGGKTMAEVHFNIGGNRWRIYSVKSLKPEWTGNWSVSIVDDQGQTLKTDQIEVVAADESSTPNSANPVPMDTPPGEVMPEKAEEISR